jgi:hypothetical protein
MPVGPGLGETRAVRLASALLRPPGACAGSDSQCYGPLANVVPGATTTIRVPFSALTAGVPISRLDPSTLVDVEWQLSAPTGGSCSASFSVKNVAFY